MKSFEKNCKNNCLNEYYMNIFDDQKEAKILTVLNYKVLLLNLNQKQNIVHLFAKNEFNRIFVFCRRFDFDVVWIQCL